jgi:hypothetical protein
MRDKETFTVHPFFRHEVAVTRSIAINSPKPVLICQTAAGKRHSGSEGALCNGRVDAIGKTALPLEIWKKESKT